MHFLPTEEQLDLQRGIREMLASAWPLEALQHLAAGEPAPDIWTALTATGVFSLRTELELGWTESVLVFEELGRACVPGPLVGSFLLAEQAPGAKVAVLDPRAEPLLVANFDVADSLLILGVPPRLVPTNGLSSSAVEAPIDPLSPLSLLPTIPGGDDLDLDIRLLCQQGALLTAALQVGIAARLTELAVDYAKTREQFGRLIGGFQAVKHICADMFARTELARVALHAAAVTHDDPEVGDIARATAGAKLLCDEAAMLNARGSVQVHGGMGFTWEVPVHFFVKRAWLHATEWGTIDDSAELVAQAL